MTHLGPYASWLAVMVALVIVSGFCSTSEAALFYLRRPERRRLAAGNRAQQTAAALLGDPSRLLTTILLWNLMINLAYFTLASIVSVRLQEMHEPGLAGAFTLGALLALIFFGELLPKSLAVIQPPLIAAAVSIPLSVLVRVTSPLLPIFRTADLLSRRLWWPGFEPEPYLQVSDLERAVRLSTADAELVEQEQKTLESLVALSEISADELMRPRVQLRVFRPPVSLADLRGQMPASGYLVINEPDSDEIVGAASLRSLSRVPTEHLERLVEPVIYVPWCMTAAQTLEALRRQNRRVAAVVNEYGETIGILPLDDILDTIFSATSSRSERLLKRLPIRQVGPDVWHVTGMTSVRRLLRHFHVEGLHTQSVTVGGIVLEMLERMPKPGDECHWGPFHLKVLDVPQHGRLLVELRLIREESP